MSSRVDDLKGEILAQARRVQSLVERALDTAFTLDAAAATDANAADDEVDRVDVEIERHAVALLTDACKAGATLTEQQVRTLLTVVKVNNELERIADVAVMIAKTVPGLRALALPAAPLPPTFRVLTNSVIGILRDVSLALSRGDAPLAKVVLMSEHAVGEFRRALGRDLQQQVAGGRMPLPLAATLSDIAMHCLTMADHCTNIAEQIIYVTTGAIVRHTESQWAEVRLNG